MTGSIFARHPEILIHSFAEMNEGYEGKSSANQGGIFRLIQQLYITIFGIPEIGFQVRSMYVHQALHRLTRLGTPVRILDVGSGIGAYVFDLCRRFPHARVEGWEIDHTKLQFAQSFAKELRADNSSFSYGDITKKPKLASRYDLLLNIDVLEHIIDYQSALRHMHMMLRPGGFLILHTPQTNQKRFFNIFETWEHEDHVRVGFDPMKLRNEMKKLGFVDIDVRHTFGFFGSLAWELNHLLLPRSLILAGLLYPLLFLCSRLDAVMENQRGLCILITAKKIS